jgi:hypothetical protein
LRISIVHSTLKDAQRRNFETLSYVWGTTERSRTIALDDGTLLRVTPTLEAALPHIVRSSKTELIWIDQICINQDDVEERCRQVAIMGQIYSMCSCVLVWLGTSTKRRDHGLQPPAAYMHRANAPGPPPTMHMQLSKAAQQQTADGLAEVLDSEWFGRAWIFQEIILPPSSRLIIPNIPAIQLPRNVPRPSDDGINVNVSLERLLDLSNRRQMANFASKNPHNDQILCEMYDRWEQHHDTSSTAPPIEQMLSRLTPHAKTSYELDRLYAFFGLNQDGFDLSPQYGISFEQALITTARSIIQGSLRLDILEYVVRNVNRYGNAPHLPSWAPDFRHPECVAPFRRFKSVSGHKSMFPWTEKFDGHLLHVRGKIIDHASVNIGAPPTDASSEAHVKLLTKLEMKLHTAWTERHVWFRRSRPRGTFTNTSPIRESPKKSNSHSRPRTLLPVWPCRTTESHASS